MYKSQVKKKHFLIDIIIVTLLYWQRDNGVLTV